MREAAFHSQANGMVRRDIVVRRSDETREGPRSPDFFASAFPTVHAVSPSPHLVEVVKEGARCAAFPRRGCTGSGSGVAARPAAPPILPSRRSTYRNETFPSVEANIVREPSLPPSPSSSTASTARNGLSQIRRSIHRERSGISLFIWRQSWE